jgi:branched-chain amino acid aminotransferase
MSLINYVNGKFTDYKHSTIPATDLSVTRGLAVFEVLRTYNGKTNHLPLHLQRLKKSVKITRMKLPKTKKEITSIIKKTIQKNYKGKELTLQIIVTGGKSKNKLLPTGKYGLIILAGKVQEFKTTVKLQTTPEQRTLPEAKITNYVPAIIAIQKARKQGFDDILYTSQKNALESSTSNIFIIKKNQLLTPKNSVLPGITRKIILEKIKLNLRKIERTVKIKEVYNADEAFITSSTRQLTPVLKVDSHVIGNGKPGPKTKEIKEKLNEYLNRINK